MVLKLLLSYPKKVENVLKVCRAWGGGVDYYYMVLLQYSSG